MKTLKRGAGCCGDANNGEQQASAVKQWQSSREAAALTTHAVAVSAANGKHQALAAKQWHSIRDAAALTTRAGAVPAAKGKPQA